MLLSILSNMVLFIMLDYVSSGHDCVLLDLFWWALCTEQFVVIDFSTVLQDCCSDFPYVVGWHFDSFNPIPGSLLNKTWMATGDIDCMFNCHSCIPFALVSATVPCILECCIFLNLIKCSNIFTLPKLRFKCNYLGNLQTILTRTHW